MAIAPVFTTTLHLGTDKRLLLAWSGRRANRSYGMILVKHLIIIVSDALEEDGRWSRHASVSRKDKAMPTCENQDISLDSDCLECPAGPRCPLYTACLRELRDIYGNCGTRPCPVRPACRNREDAEE